MTSNQYPHIEGAQIWDCPCDECTRLDWEALDDGRPTLTEFRRAARADYDREREL